MPTAEAEEGPERRPIRARRWYQNGLKRASGIAPDKPKRLQKGPIQRSDKALRKGTEKAPEGAARGYCTGPFAPRLRGYLKRCACLAA